MHVRNCLVIGTVDILAGRRGDSEFRVRCATISGNQSSVVKMCNERRGRVKKEQIYLFSIFESMGAWS